MPVSHKTITLFEHQTLKLDQVIDDVTFDLSKLKALQAFYGERSVPYFSLIHNGIKFKEYVGVIQVGKTIIEILPKADNHYNPSEEGKWRGILIDMIRSVGIFDIHAPSSSSLKLKPNSILDLYFELFITEVEYLLHQGLIKQYRKKEANLTTLKGSLQFGKHLQQNLTHQERFYVRHTTYDTEHKLHFILYKTLSLLKQLNTNVDLSSRLGSLLLYFPEMPDISITESNFDRLVYNRKTQSYKKAMDIAKLLLLHYHPDISRGRNDVLALMFDMNLLWEKFVYVSLRKYLNSASTINAQIKKLFWKPEQGANVRICPDIVIDKGLESCIILDTKWKNLNGNNPSHDDLRQMYVYHEYFGAKKVALVFPGYSDINILQNKGSYYTTQEKGISAKECSVILIPVRTRIKEWQKEIAEEIGKWVIQRYTT